MTSLHREHLSVAEQAAEWLQELQAGNRESPAFLKWLRASPLHVQELLIAGRVQAALRTVDPQRRIDVDALIARATANTNVLPLDARAQVPEPHPGPYRRRRWPLSVAAGLVAVALAGWFVHAEYGGAQRYATERGEQRMLKLSDGSVVFLNTQSRAQVRYTADVREIQLDRGQALFQVQHDAHRPFRVHAGSAMIQAIGTEFDVRLDARRATVAVIEGLVQVSSNGGTSTSRHTGSALDKPTRIAAGERAIVDTGGQVESTAPVDTRVVTAWRQQRLIFHETPLSEIADEFNRYNAAPRLRVEGEARRRRFDGSFNALQPESFLTYLSREQDVQFEHRKDEVVIRER